MPDSARKPEHPDEINFLDAETQECPYPSYELLRDAAPVWKDPITGFYVVTRYDDLREILMDTEHYGNESQSRQTVHSDRMQKVRELYETKGWLPAPTLAARDDPNHKQMRAMFDDAFRAGRIRELDPIVRDIAYELIDDLIDDGHCDWVKQFAIPLPLKLIGLQMGAREEDLWQIKAWTEAWVQRLGMMQTEEEELWSVEMEIEAQQYFQPIFERLRVEPNDSLLSDLVNLEIEGWAASSTTTSCTRK